MEWIYQWIRQIAVFSVISFLILYVMGNQEKKNVLYFYLSMLMLLLILKPVSAFLHFDERLAGKIASLEMNTEMQAVNGQVEEIVGSQDQKITEYTSQQVLSWIKGMVEDEKMKFLGGKVTFDEERLKQTGEVLLTGIEISVSCEGKSRSEIEPDLKQLKKKITDLYAENPVEVTIKFRDSASAH